MYCDDEREKCGISFTKYLTGTSGRGSESEMPGKQEFFYGHGGGHQRV